jgi:hypothetical protein
MFSPTADMKRFRMQSPLGFAAEWSNGPAFDWRGYVAKMVLASGPAKRAAQAKDIEADCRVAIASRCTAETGLAPLAVQGCRQGCCTLGKSSRVSSRYRGNDPGQAGPGRQCYRNTRNALFILLLVQVSGPVIPFISRLDPLSSYGKARTRLGKAAGYLP